MFLRTMKIVFQKKTRGSSSILPFLLSAHTLGWALWLKYKRHSLLTGQTVSGNRVSSQYHFCVNVLVDL